MAPYICLFDAGSCRLGSNNLRNSSNKGKRVGLVRVSRRSFRFLWLWFQQTFTVSKSTREKLKVVVILMSLLLTLNIIHTIVESLLLTLNRKKFIWVAFSDYETTSICIDFFQTIKRCCQVHVQASIGIFQKEAIFC